MDSVLFRNLLAVVLGIAAALTWSRNHIIAFVFAFLAILFYVLAFRSDD